MEPDLCKRVLSLLSEGRIASLSPQAHMHCLSGFPRRAAGSHPSFSAVRSGSRSVLAMRAPDHGLRRSAGFALRNQTIIVAAKLRTAPEGNGPEFSRAVWFAQAALPVPSGSSAQTGLGLPVEFIRPASASRPRLTRLFTVPSLHPRICPASS